MKLNKVGTALVTGSAKRVGARIALALAEMGYDIVIHYNNSKKEAAELSKKISQKYKVKTAIIAADLCNYQEVRMMADFMIKNFKDWSLLINNASIFNQSKFLDDNDVELFDNINIHLIAPLLLAQEFGKNIKRKKIKNAQIINIIDKNILRVKTKYFYYLLSKKFLAELTKMSALELAPEVRVNGIAPGLILPEEKANLQVKDIKEKISLQKIDSVENVIQTIKFLLENDFVSGEIIFVDGVASLNQAG